MTSFEQLKMHSPNLVDANIDKIASLFPNCITEAQDEDGIVKKAIDFDLLRQELSHVLVEGDQERYRLDWPGKKEAILTANAPIAKTLRPCREESVNFDTTENLFIEGDNLDALKLLQENYLGKVKMIYIDPPYNTGNDFIYEDDFAESTEAFFEKSHQFDEEGNRLISNTESNGRFHSDWLSMIYSRLKLSKNLLVDDGLIFISIDDNERDNLKKICDEIFGENNFIDPIIWKKRYGGGAKEKFLVALHEYVLVYCRDKNLLKNLFVPLSDEQIKRYYINKDENYDVRGGYRTHPLEAMKSFDVRENLSFGIPAPDGTIVNPKRQWRWGEERVLEALQNNEIEFKKGKSGEWVLSSKQYLKELNGEIRKTKPFTIIDDVYTQHGTNEILDLMGDAKIFDFPKPTGLLKQLITIGFNFEKTGIILDFFAGSGSLADAVMQYNCETLSNVSYVAVQLPQKVNEKSEAYKAGFKTIAEISKERIRRAGQKILADNADKEGIENLDIGFRVLKVDSSNMKDVYYTPDSLKKANLDFFESNIKEERTDEDLLFQVMLDWGLELSLPIEPKQIADKTVYFVAENSLVACFQPLSMELIDQIAQQRPLRFVSAERAIVNDQDKTNIRERFKQLSPETDVKFL